MRVFDAAIHNRIANDPLVRPSFGWIEGPVSFDEEVGWADSYVFLTNDEQDAAAIFEWSAPGIWQVHTMALGSCRGRRAIEAGNLMIGWMFAEHGAEMLWGLTPVENRPAKLFNRLMGATSVGMRDHHVCGPCEVFTWRNH